MIDVYPPHPKGEAEPHPAAVWVDLTNPTESEIELVEAFTGFDLPTRGDLSAIENSSRLSFKDEVLRLAMPIMAKTDTDHPSVAHLGLVLSRRILITIHDEPLKLMRAACANTPAGAKPLSSSILFVALLEAFVDREADLLEEARAKLDVVSHRVFRTAANSRLRAARSSVIMRERLQTLGRIGERTSVIRESLLAVERMIPFVLDAAPDWFDVELKRRLQTVREDIASLSQFEEHLLGKVQFLLDAVLGFVSIEQNDIFKVLTIASVVGIFPTLVAGWYGMNFQRMPELSWTYGYPFGIGAIVLSTIIPLVWFKWRGWL